MDKHIVALMAAAELPHSDVRLSQLADVPTETLTRWRIIITEAIALQRDRADNGEPPHPPHARASTPVEGSYAVIARLRGEVERLRGELRGRAAGRLP